MSSHSFISLSLSLFLAFFFCFEEFFSAKKTTFLQKEKKRWRKSPRWKKKKKKKNRDACGRHPHRRILRSTEMYFSINSYGAMRCDFHPFVRLCVQAMIRNTSRGAFFYIHTQILSFERTRKHIEMRFFYGVRGEARAFFLSLDARARPLSSSVLFLPLSLSLSKCFVIFLCLCAGREMSPLSLSLVVINLVVVLLLLL